MCSFYLDVGGHKIFRASSKKQILKRSVLDNGIHVRQAAEGSRIVRISFIQGFVQGAGWSKEKKVRGSPSPPPHTHPVAAANEPYQRQLKRSTNYSLPHISDAFERSAAPLNGNQSENRMKEHQSSIILDFRRSGKKSRTADCKCTQPNVRMASFDLAKLSEIQQVIPSAKVFDL